MVKQQDYNKLIDLLKGLKNKGIPEEEHHQYLSRFLENKARNLGIPINGCFELTPLCNLDWKMCYIHLDNSSYDKKELLTPAIWKSIIKQAHESGMVSASLTGGECLTYDGFNDVYLFLYHLGIKPGIMTNGVLIDEDRVSFFKRYPPKMVQVSLYGSSEDAYERVTGRRVFRTVYSNLARLREEAIPVRITITPNEYMETEVYDFFKLVKALKIPYYINANLIPPRKNTGRSINDISVDNYIELYRIQNEKKLVQIDPVELPDQNNQGYIQYGLACGAGRSSFTIQYDGNMCPCSSLYEITADTIKYGFKAAWKIINEKATHYPLPIECGGCIYYDRCLRCAAMHKNAEVEGHCDSRICERTKKLICAGFIPMPDIK